MTPKKLSCVIVDDESANLDILTDYVNQIPYLVLKATFNKPIEALAFLLKTPTDLLITDITMPRLSGIELYESICSFVDTQVIFVSGFSDKIIEAIQYSVVDYLHKPIPFERFEKAIHKALVLINSFSENYDDIPIEVLELALKKYIFLSPSEKRVLELIAKGNSTFAITQILNNSIKTIQSHRYAIRKKLELNSDNSLTNVSRFIMERLKDI